MHQSNFLRSLLVSPTFRLSAVEPAKEPTLVERLNAWLKDKATLTAERDAALARATQAEAALLTATTDFNAKATTAEQALATATAAHTAALEAKAGEVTTLKASLASVGAEKETLNSQLTALHSLFATIGFKPAEAKAADGTPLTGAPLVAALQAQFKQCISTATLAQIRELGFNASALPPPTPAGGSPDTVKEMSYADFSQLSPAAKMKFSVAGGRLTDLPVGRN